MTLERIRSFVRVVERGSLSAVARELRVGQSTISRHIRELEEAVGTPLLSRSTRRVSPTDEGRRYLSDCREILRLVEKAADDARAARAGATGTVRISCTAAFAVRQLSRLLFDFQDRHPDIVIDLGITDDRVDLVREGVDLAVRLGPVEASTMRMRALGRSRQILVAAPTYLQARGAPAQPSELVDHEGIRMSNIAGSDMLTLRDAAGREHRVAFGGALTVDHGLAAREAAAAGRGIIPAHVWLVEDLLALGELVQVLPDHTLPTVPLNLMIAPARRDLTRVRLLIDDLADRVPRVPGLDAATTSSTG